MTDFIEKHGNYWFQYPSALYSVYLNFKIEECNSADLEFEAFAVFRRAFSSNKERREEKRALNYEVKYWKNKTIIQETR